MFKRQRSCSCHTLIHPIPPLRRARCPVQTLAVSLFSSRTRFSLFFPFQIFPKAATIFDPPLTIEPPLLGFSTPMPSKISDCFCTPRVFSIEGDLPLTATVLAFSRTGYFSDKLYYWRCREFFCAARSYGRRGLWFPPDPIRRLLPRLDPRSDMLDLQRRPSYTFPPRCCCFCSLYMHVVLFFLFLQIFFLLDFSRVVFAPPDPWCFAS